MSRPDEQSPRRPFVGWHPLDPVSLVAGLVFVVLAVLSLTDLSLDAGVVLPVLLLTGGALGLVVAVRRPRTD